MMSDVVLVQPRFERFQPSHTYPTNPPLGLAYLGAALKGEGFTVEAVDLTTNPGEIQKDCKLILHFNPRVIGISVTTPTLLEVYKLTTELRKKGFAGLIVLGGPHITVRPEAVSTLEGDFGLAGECEHTLPQLYDTLIKEDILECRNTTRHSTTHNPQLYDTLINKDTKYKEIHGLSRRDGKLVGEEEIAYISDLNALPLPERALFSMERYQFAHLICSRGCPYSCTYCSMAGTPYRARHPQDIVDELASLARDYPWLSIGFGDDVFTMDRTLAEGICKEIKARSLDVQWSCTTRADTADKSLLQEMKSAGCWHISFGVESGVEAIRTSLGKCISNAQYESIFLACRELGIKSRAYAIFGHPSETVRDMRETISFIKKLNPDEAFFSLTSIYPKTRLARQAIAEGKIPEDVWERCIQLEQPTPLYLPDNVTIEDVKAIIGETIQTIYLSPRSIVKRLLKARSLNELQQELSALYGFIADAPSI